MKKRIVKIALGQFASIHGETQQNLNKMLTMTDQAAESGADLIVFPELAYSGYFCTSYQMQQCAEKQDGPFVQALREKAKDKSMLQSLPRCLFRAWQIVRRARSLLPLRAAAPVL